MSPRQKKHNTPEQSAADDHNQATTASIDARLKELPAEVVELVEQLRAERDEAQAAKMRSLADFKNFQRRSMENEARAMESGSTRVVRALLPVLDQFELALQHHAGRMTVEQLAAGVDMVRQELNKALQSCGLATINPQPGSEFDPQQHEAVMHQPSDEHPAGSVLNVFQSGYRLDDRVLRPAKVVIVSGPAEPQQEQPNDADV